MILKQIQLTHFRNHTKSKFSFDSKKTLIIGPNTSGKTSIVEAIALLLRGKSFRAETIAEMIQDGYEVAHIKGFIGDENKIEISITGGIVNNVPTQKKILKINGIELSRNEHENELPVSVFWPEDLRLITGSPGRKRDYFDDVLTQTNKEYKRALYRYSKALRARNALLQQQLGSLSVTDDEFEYWSDELIKNGTIISTQRNNLVVFINAHQEINGYRYKVAFIPNECTADRLEKTISKEQQTGVTTVGPHRDEFSVLVSQQTGMKNVRQYGSRGEQRLAVLWLKQSEVLFLEENLHTSPLLLLDDIYSELDLDHREALFSLLSDHQVIITALEKPKGLPDKISIIDLRCKI
jgi:DNA replication and repair protein RecF